LYALAAFHQAFAASLGSLHFSLHSASLANASPAALNCFSSRKELAACWYRSPASSHLVDDEENHPAEELDFLSAFSRRISAGDLGMVVVESRDTLNHAFGVGQRPTGDAYISTGTEPQKA
jgi:hypothetical protein